MFNCIEILISFIFPSIFRTTFIPLAIFVPYILRLITLYSDEEAIKVKGVFGVKKNNSLDIGTRIIVDFLGFDLDDDAWVVGVRISHL